MERFSLLVYLATLSLFLPCIHAVPQVPCYFIFGDSLSDDGNNNGLPTLAKVNYPPYGVDYQQGPTGRFSNGKNIQDVIAEKLGFSSPIPPFASACGNILNGVNYASGAAGILPESGGVARIQTLYNDGARKFALFAIGRIGCTPYAVAVFGTKGSPCVDTQNQAVRLFNEALLSLVKELNAKMPDAKFTYINPYRFSSTGFVTNASCCKLDKGGQLCLPNSVPCSNRSKYVYWDGVHPTEAINILAGTVAYKAKSTSNAYPFNLQSLALK
ncbi:hypothetical protein SLE2022_150320 [Rubroshorea leprosula]